MPSTYKTPGVYIEEVSVFPPSIAQVETAVPAFIGYTERHSKLGEDLKLKPVKIRSLAEYEELFGKGPPTTVESIQLDSANNVTATSLADGFLLYDSLRLFYANGGAKCYIISIGVYPATTAGTDDAGFKAGLAQLEKEDEPTLILFPDAVFLAADKIIALQQAALAQAAKLGDRFCILDVRPDEKNEAGQVTSGFIDKAAEFRNAIGVKNLKYGAAYGPYLKTNLEKSIRYRDVKGKIRKAGADVPLSGLTSDAGTIESLGFLDSAVSDRAEFKTLFPDGTEALEATFIGAESDFKAKMNDPSASVATQRTAYKNLIVAVFDILKGPIEAIVANTGNKFTQGITDSAGKPLRFLFDDVAVSVADGKPGAFHTAANTLLALATHSARIGVASAISDVVKASALGAAGWGAFVPGTPGDYYAVDNGPPTGDAKTAAERTNMRQGAATATGAFKAVLAEVSSLAETAAAHEDTYENALVATFPLLKTIIDRSKNAVTEMPPSAAIAGVYADVDATRGVHKAPANVSLNSVIGLTEVVSHEQQEDLNVDVVAGKSINVIRPFTGKGILVWGARTLAGNDNEWRYVSVRRFFNMVEESAKKATDQFVFEPNDANTWTKVKAMIENFLINQWRSGALAGSTPEKAFFVRVGLGQTMTAQDVLEGKMIVVIGMAAVRPAEFIILRFSHKMQEA